MLTRDTVSCKCQTHSRANIILIRHLCFLFPFNHSHSRSLWSLAALPSLMPCLCSFPFYTLHCLPQQVTSDSCTDPFISSCIFFQVRHAGPYGASPEQKPVRHLKQDHEDIWDVHAEFIRLIVLLIL